MSGIKMLDNLVLQMEIYLSERPVTVWISYIGIIFQYVLETRFNKGNFQKPLQKHVNWAGRENSYFKTNLKVTFRRLRIKCSF